MSLVSKNSDLVFFIYAQKDKPLRERLEDHLSILKYQGLITTWYDQEIQAGEETIQQIIIHLNQASIILLLISSDFMASLNCRNLVQLALTRHEKREARVIPILLRPVLFRGAPFASLEILPSNRKPVVKWKNRDDAFVNIALGIENILQGRSLTNNLPAPRGSVVSYRRSASAFILSLLLLIFSLMISLLAFFPNRITYLIGVIMCILVLIVMSILSLLRLIDFIMEQRKKQVAHKWRIREYYQRGLLAYKRALDADPHNAEAARGQGNTLYELGYYKQALDAYKQAMQLDPLFAHTYKKIGNTYKKLRERKKAEQFYKKAKELERQYPLNR